MIRSMTLLTVALGLAAVPAHAHDVKDPVCRMTVDSDTTKHRHQLGSKTFYFCSEHCVKTFAGAPEKYEKLAERLASAELREYTAAVTTSPARPMARQPVEMTFAIRYADDNSLVRDYELVHEKLLHLLLVSEDLSWFEHQHPVRGEDGLFRLTWRFPRPGPYRLYVDFTPADGDNQVKPLPLAIHGGPAKHYPLKPDRKRVKQKGDYRVELQVRSEPLTMETAAVLTYTIRDRQGRPIEEMQPFIGAMGHMVAISEDGEQIVHTHALHPTAPSAMEHAEIHVTPEMATETGPTFSFKLTLPTSGLYKTWVQFMHAHRVLTVPFTFRVEELW